LRIEDAELLALVQKRLETFGRKQRANDSKDSKDSKDLS